MPGRLRPRSCRHRQLRVLRRAEPDSALDLVPALQRGERPHPTRGAPLTDFRAVELQIAGIFTDLGDQVTATAQSPETLRGVRLAERNGETAPAMPETAPDFPPLPEKK